MLAKNDALAAKNRAWFAGREILALNLVSSPGAGKTTLLERTIRDLKEEAPLYVLEGDQATANDGMRIRAAGAPAVQINTGTGCHLEADMVARGLMELKPAPGSMVMIENVGNLVCPALFDLGERAKVVILSVTEGEDKPLKYPHMFHAAGVMILNKVDLLPHVDFDVEQAIANAQEVNPGIEVLCVSARSGEGLEAGTTGCGSSAKAPAPPCWSSAGGGRGGCRHRCASVGETRERAEQLVPQANVGDHLLERGLHASPASRSASILDPIATRLRKRQSKRHKAATEAQLPRGLPCFASSPESA